MWETRYAATPGYLFGTAPAAFLSENPWVTHGARTALVVADGEGRNAVHLAQAGLQVTSFDLSPTAVSRAQALAKAANVPGPDAVSAPLQGTLAPHVSDWEGWDWHQSYDLVVGIFIQFANPQARAGQFATMRQATKPGGRLALHGYTPDQIALGTGGPPCGDHMYTAELLGQHFGDWQIERLASYQRDVQEGRGHSGQSALIDLVARRPA